MAAIPVYLPLCSGVARRRQAVVPTRRVFSGPGLRDDNAGISANAFGIPGTANVRYVESFIVLESRVSSTKDVYFVAIWPFFPRDVCFREISGRLGSCLFVRRGL